MGRRWVKLILIIAALVLALAAVDSLIFDQSVIEKTGLVSVNAISKSVTANVASRQWLMYFAQAGFSNQLVCLEHAFYIARILNRSMVLPPILPHSGAGATGLGDVFDFRKGSYKLSASLEDFYLRGLPPESYIPLHHVIDVEFSLPEVETIDARAFFAEWDEPWSQWTIESEYSHFNTKWIHNQTDLEGQREVEERLEWGYPRTLATTYRDITNSLNNSASAITLLDSFLTTFGSTSMKKLGFRPRFSEPIRRVAKKIQEGWHVDKYVAVHIRGGDGGFGDRKNATMTATIQKVSGILDEWARLRQDTSVTKVGLYIATDIKQLAEDPIFHENISVVIETMQRTHDVSVELLWGSKNQVDDHLTAYVRFPEIFLDQQLCACASIGFVGSSKSTFSGLIQRLRQHGSACS